MVIKRVRKIPKQHKPFARKMLNQTIKGRTLYQVGTVTYSVPKRKRK